MLRATLSSDERLKSRKQINFLFDEGSQLFSHPLKAFYYIHDHEDENHGLRLKFGVTVPKSLFKRAVDRNRIKRQIREAYRIQKAQFLSDSPKVNKSVDWFFIYIDKSGKIDKLDHAFRQLFIQLEKLL